MNLRLLLTAACVALLASPLSAQGDSAAETALAALMTRNGVTRIYTGTIEMTVTVTVERAAPCEFVVVDRTESVAPHLDSLTLPLRALSPAVRLEKWEDRDVWSVYVETTSGRPELSIRRALKSPSGRIAVPVGKQDFSYHDETVAQAVAAGLGKVIRACGGTPQPAEVRSRVAAASIEEEGNDPASLRMKESCKQTVAEMMRNPPSATFAPVEEWSVIARDRTRERTFSSTVEAANAMGGRVRATFFCTFEKIGDSWVPRGRPLIAPVR